MIHEIILPIIYVLIPIGSFLVFCKIWYSHKIEVMKTQQKIKKQSETLESSLSKLIDDAPNNLKQINSEIATLREKAAREHLTPEQTKNLLARLESERSMLEYAVKYGNYAKPLIKPIDKLVSGLLAKVSNIGG